jgi:hypothetical protein
VIAAEGLPRIWRRPEAARGPVRREIQPRAEICDVAELPAVRVRPHMKRSVRPDV